MNLGFLAGAYVRAGDLARGAEMVQALERAPRPARGRALYHAIVEELGIVVGACN